ncbi:MAG: Smr/MutS family protein, partial [Desulfobulbaceae bacterium]|nr:Smr/MutS family protein [Desulfobulbaceae bacterium]
MRRLTTDNPFTADGASFADLLKECDLDAGVARHIQEKKALMKKKPKGVKGYPPVQAVLDLHGETASSAGQRILLFLHTSIQQGLKTVRIITGKGLHSPGGMAVLPDVTEMQLVLLKHEGVVFDFVWDKKLKV